MSVSDLASEYVIVVGIAAPAIYEGELVVWPNIIETMNEHAKSGFRFSSLLWRGLPEDPKNTNGQPIYEVLMERPDSD